MSYADGMPPALGAPPVAAASRTAAAGALRLEPWLWSARRDLWVFGGSALAALFVVALGHGFGFASGPLPEWAFLVFVLGVDVAHVYATLFRTYLDGAELRARPARYVLTPLFAYAAGVAAYSVGALAFWRCLAYLALFHFVRQEIGWLRVQRVKARGLLWDARLDELALYAGALYPVWLWHSDPDGRQFSWFVPGDFWALSGALSPLTSAVRALWLLVLGAFVFRQLWLLIVRGVARPLPCLIVGKTALIWYVGIVLCNSDFDFTVTNVVAHGVPYFALLWSYAREQRRTELQSFGARVAGRGVFVFLLILLGLAAFEEGLWDRWLNHDHPWLFGDGPEFGVSMLRFVVPLLAVPQLTHYLLDARLWRSVETRRLPAQRLALGLLSSEESRS
jgi:hypothetical protein